MFGSEILEVGIGLVFVYVLLSIMCTAIREGIEAFLKTRAAYLERAIRDLLGPTLATDLYKHPLLRSLCTKRFPKGKAPAAGATATAPKSRKITGHGFPSYIPPDNFAMALMDIAARGPDLAVNSGSGTPVLDVQSLRDNIEQLGNEPLQRLLLTLTDSAGNDINKARAAVEAWYNGVMERVAGWYKRSTQWILFVIAIGVTVAVNVNTITIADYLYRDSAARGALVAQAQTAVTDTTFLTQNYAAVRTQVESLNLPIGWANGLDASGRVKELGLKGAWHKVFMPILGLLLTALAATLGAPFWFDVLGKITTIRSTVKPRQQTDGGK